MIDMKLQTPSDLARIVKNARAQRNLTQKEVADAAGITRQSLARLERGNGGTSFDTVLLILDHLGIHLDAITERSTTSTPVPPGDAAQAAADALAKRVAPLIASGALGALNNHLPAALNRINEAVLPNLDTSGIFAQFDAAALTSIREASRRVADRITIPGSVLVNPPRAVEAKFRNSASAARDPDLDAPGIAE